MAISKVSKTMAYRKRGHGFSRWALALDHQLDERGQQPLNSTERYELHKNWHPGKSVDDSLRELDKIRSRSPGTQASTVPLSGQALVDHVNAELEKRFKGFVVEPRVKVRLANKKPQN